DRGGRVDPDGAVAGAARHQASARGELSARAGDRAADRGGGCGVGREYLSAVMAPIMAGRAPI
ncbi:MAG: hypothetical protein SGJ24_17260, partial [Chloroflexota bacterium]|nr:hypothetical protein [Chloroflexota bacterium]